ncbi:MAG: preprotein translocase subunit SecA [Pseudomonadota bacterium]|nr:preprotein translocase subunit SecA [Pseudomonadota bacterium]
MLRYIFGTKNSRELKRYRKIVKKINQLEASISALDDQALAAKTAEFKAQLEAGKTPSDLLIEAFAVVREASKRVLGMRHFDVQLIGGMVLHEGRIAEMRTGEGKTLVATLPTYLNALSGNGVHVVTVNDYLARRDAQWMQPLYEFLGLSVASVLSGQALEEKKAAYQCDILYATNNELGFDYLRDNMVFSLDQKVQRPFHYAIIDEVDSILIDEARTPLIISGSASDSSALYKAMNVIPPQLKEHIEEEVKGENEKKVVQEGDYKLDEKNRQVELTEQGHQVVENILTKMKVIAEDDSLYSPKNLALLHHVNVALRAHVLFKKDVDYIVQDSTVVIVDEHTGRTMEGRRWSDGLHQAVEAKEGVAIQNENQTLASTTFQNYFRMYPKLSGMTGTADTEAVEFHQIYGLDVVMVPTNKPIQRNDMNDVIYMTQEEKFEAIIKDVNAFVEKGAPVLVGTASIDTSELLSTYLKKAGVKHEVLNAKQHAREADIVAQAGRPGSVTIATNMAGRGTDIVLGGSLEAELAANSQADEQEQAKIRAQWEERHAAVLEAGGLHIIGSERHESRRIDNQLRGRAGRQGDPGLTRFYLSMDDNLLRIFAGDTVRNMMKRVGMERGEALEFGMLSRSIEKAQRKVEGHNFDIRKNLLEYDDIANEQRQIIYQQRDDILETDDLMELVLTMRGDALAELVTRYIPMASHSDDWDIDGLQSTLANEYRIELDIQGFLDEDKARDSDDVMGFIDQALTDDLQAKADNLGADESGQPIIQLLLRQLMLQILDRNWKEHLSNMNHLRKGINLRGYGQKNPKQEYKRESFEMFQSLLAGIQGEFTKTLAAVEIKPREVQEYEEQQAKQAERDLNLQHESSDLGVEDEARQVSQGAQPAQALPKVGRNEPCPCGSGKKYKHCHGSIA